MKSLLRWISMIISVLSIPTRAQTINDELTDELDETTLTISLEFDEVASCDALDQRITDRLTDHKELWNQHRYPIMYMMDDMMIAEESMAVADGIGGGGDVTTTTSVASSTNEYSTTNIQKIGIDEADIYKTDGNILYYYNNTDHMIYLIQSPLDRINQTITLSDMQILSQISIPETLESSTLYVYDDELIIIGSRRKQNPHRRGWFDKSSTTFVARYDITISTNPSLINYTEYDGYLLDSRLSLTDGTLIVMTTISPSWYIIWADASIDERDIVLPRTISITPTETTWQSTISSISCDQTFLLLPDDKTLEQLGDRPSFTTIHTLDLDDNTTSDYATFGAAGQIHVSQDHIYLAQHIWLPQGHYSCPIDARCAMPMIRWGNINTLIHGFERDGITLSYQWSNLVEGSGLGDQYSMDEHDGYFRILTSVWWPEQNTHLRVLDEDLNLVGDLTNIQAGERFQWSRFIDDKLYLITFEQIDPLFVIDLADQTDPTIIGELKMPGRSNYLHPIDGQDTNTQYLIGVGYDAGINQRGGTSREGVKVDLYAVHYDEKETADSLCGSLDDSEEYATCLTYVDTDRIRVDRLDSLVFGAAESYTPVASNPRLFVYRANTGQLTLPLLEKWVTKEIKRCTVIYEDDVRTETMDCRSDIQYQDTFAGYKVISIDPAQWADAMSVVSAQNFLEELTVGVQQYNKRYYNEQYGLGSQVFDQIGPRVAFAWDTQLFLTNYFVHAHIQDKEYMLPLLEITWDNQ